MNGTTAEEITYYCTDINDSPLFILVNKPCYVICSCGDTRLVDSSNYSALTGSTVPAIIQPFIYRYDYNLYSSLLTSGYAFIEHSSSMGATGYQTSGGFNRATKFQLDFVFGCSEIRNNKDRNDMPRIKMPEIGVSPSAFKLNPVKDRNNSIFNLAVINSKYIYQTSSNNYAALVTIAVVPAESSNEFRCSILTPISKKGSSHGQIFNDNYSLINDYVQYANLADVLPAERYPEFENKKLISCAAATFSDSFTGPINPLTFTESPLHQFFRENFIEA